jgi:thymidylate kinase
MLLAFALGTSHILNEAAKIAQGGQSVIMDRTYLSNFAYRCAKGMPAAKVKLLVAQYLPEVEYIESVYYIDVPDDVRRQRCEADARAEGRGTDRIESRGWDFQVKVAMQYRTLVSRGLMEPVDGNRPFDAVANDISLRIRARLGG